MPHTPVSAAACGIFVATLALVGAARAQSAGHPGAVTEVSLPGGLRAAMTIVGDELAPDRAHFLADFIRRIYDTPLGTRDDPRSTLLQSLLAHLTAAAPRPGPRDTLPLPLPARVWIDVVFDGRASPGTLIAAILQSRGASLFYCGLLALDDDTRAWLAGQPKLIADLATVHPAAFLAVASGLRMTSSGLQLPGGAAAEPVWHALTGRRPSDPVEFVRALVTADDGRLAYFFGAIAQLPPARASELLTLRAPDAKARVESARRVAAIFERLLGNRSIERRAFSRLSADPALLVAELSADGTGGVIIPGTRGLWAGAFAGSDGPIADNDRARREWDEPADLPWLCEQIFSGEPTEDRRRYMMVLFAARRIAPDMAGTRRDTLDAVRAAGVYPALSSALERAGVTDLATFAAATRRADQIATIGDEGRAVRALAQFQGALALVGRAAVRGSVPPAKATALVTSLSAVPLSSGGDYEGRLTEWLIVWLHESGRRQQSPLPAAAHGSADEVFASAAGPIEAETLRLLAGSVPPQPVVVEWEGTRYRVDLARAEALRLVKTLGHSPRAWLSAAAAAVTAAQALADPSLTRDGLRQQAEALAEALEGDGEGAVEASRLPLARGDVLPGLRNAAKRGDLRAAARLTPALRLIADDLLARGLTEMAYAAALGDRDGISISPAEAAARHDFGARSALRRSTPWRLPLPGTDQEQRWRISGSLLGLDVGLADFALVRLSAKPPPRRPTLSDDDRRVFIEAVALVAPASLTDSDRDRIVTAMRQGQALLAAMRSPEAVLGIADTIALSAQRRTLLPWVLANEPERARVFLSPGELLRLGLGDAAIGSLHAWGASGGPRLGCLCLRMVDRQPWETFAGRGHLGMSASVFPDLNLRLADLLAELRMPAVLLPAVLAAATLDFVNSTISRDPDDRRGLVEFVQTLRLERVEQYLALLTTDGPLVPIGDAGASTALLAASPDPGARRQR